MKTKEELDALKQEVEALNAKLAALSEDELAQVAGGNAYSSISAPSFKPEFQFLPMKFARDSI